VEAQEVLLETALLVQTIWVAVAVVALETILVALEEKEAMGFLLLRMYQHMIQLQPLLV
jgi:hypothetical protein